MMRFAVTTPEVLKVLQRRQLEKALSYRERLKPFNFIQSPLINRQPLGFDPKTNRTLRLGYPLTADPNRFTLIAPSTDDTSLWYRIRYINIHDDKWVYLAPLDKKQSFEASPYTLDDVIGLYHTHPESKSLGPDGTPCGSHTAGLLQRTSITADDFDHTGKQTDRKWEQDEDLSMLFPILPIYRQSESARLEKSSTIQRQACTASIRQIVRRTGLSTRTVRAARKGKRLRKTTIAKIEKVFRDLEIERLDKEEDLESAPS